MQTALAESPVTTIAPPPTVTLFDIPGCNLSPISLKIEDWVGFEEWEQIGRALEIAERAVQWWIGDWLNHGLKKWGDKAAQVVDVHEKTGIPVGTLMVYQWVADSVKPITRVMNVSWTIHREVATLPEAEQREVLAHVNDGEKPKSAREVQKEVGRIRRRLGLDPTDITILREPKTIEWLNNLRQLLSEHEKSVPPKAVFLRGMIHAMTGVIDGQLERTLESDCLIVREAAKLILGTDDEIYAYLQSTFYFMSDPELDDALTMLVQQKRLKKKQAEGRKKGQKGKMVDVYLPIKNDIDDDEDFDAEAL